MNRPYIIISTAMSLDGKIATSSRKPVKLSNRKDFEEVDKLRSECDAILVGSTTLKTDNPKLLIKNKKFRLSRLRSGKPENPAKVAISKYCDIPSNSYFLKGNSKKYIFTTKLASSDDVKRVKKFAEVFATKENKFDTRKLVKILFENGIKKLLIEGGGSTNFEFAKNNLVDEFRIAIFPKIFGYLNAPSLVDGTGLKTALNLKMKKIEKFDEIVVLWYKNERQ